MTYILIHNPGCGSSKKGLELLKANGIEPQIRKYMSAAERLSVEELKDIAKKMGTKSPEPSFARRTPQPPASPKLRLTRKSTPRWQRTRSSSSAQSA